MERTTSEEVYVREYHRKRELAYCLLSVTANILIPVFWYFTGFDLVEHVHKNEELSLNLMVYVAGVELFKVILIMVMYPLSNVSGPNLRERRRGSVELGVGRCGAAVYEEFDEAAETEPGEIPKYDGVKIWEKDENSTLFGARDKDDEDQEDNDELSFTHDKPHRRRRKRSDRGSWIFLALEIIKGILCFALSVGAGHILIVLFGAPVLADRLLTFQFSFILMTWLFLPLCINILPATVIFEVLFMRFWDTEVEWVHRSQLRFIATLFGAWCGAIAFPLDWDRPWQRWPIPCLVSLFLFYTLFHCLGLLYFAGLIYSKTFRRIVTFGGPNKVKVY